MPFIIELEAALRQKASRENALPMEKYMRNLFSFFGIKTKERRQILKEVWAKNQLEVTSNTREIITQLWAKEQREFHYCAIEIAVKKLKNKYVIEDILLIEKWITTHSWWDSVDSIAKNILGEYLLKFPQATQETIARFSNSKNMWLNRSALLFQLSYKAKTNAAILFAECTKHASSDEFFIQKAIGWALREFGKTNPELVRKFVAKTNLKPLSKKEALKNIY